MAVTPTTFYRDQLPSSSATLYTVPSGKTVVVTSISLACEGGVARTATLKLNGKTLLPAVSIDSSKAVVFSLKQVMTAGQVLSGFASAASTVTANVCGVEIT